MSGTRLRARRIHADGVSQFLGWYDTVEQIECTKGQVGAQPACAPPYDPNPGYAYPTEACDPASRLVVTRSLGCDAKVQAIGVNEPPIDADAAALTTLYRLGATEAFTQCWAGSTCQVDLFSCVLAPVGAELSTVSAQTSIEGGARLRTYADGARELDAFVAGEAACEPRLAADGTRRCFAQQEVATAAYLDDACTDAIYRQDQVHDGRLAVETADACGVPTRRMFEVGAPPTDAGPLTTLPIYTRRPDGSCGTTGSQPSAFFVRLGAEIAVDTLPAVGATEHGAGRLRARYDAVSGHERFTTWFDTELGTACRFEPRDQELRCVPSERVAPLPRSGSVTVYGDPQCLSLVRLDAKPPGDACTVSPAFYTDNMPQACTATGALFRLVPPVAAYVMQDGVCTPSPLDLNGYVALEPLAPAALAVGNAMTE